MSSEKYRWRLIDKLGTVEWHREVNMTLLGVIVVDTFKMWNGLKMSQEPEKQFYENLAEELIDNEFDGRVTRSSPSRNSVTGGDGRIRRGVHIHLTPTKKRRKNKPNQLAQGRCKICGNKSSNMCSLCQDNGKSVFLCDTRSGRSCFATHIENTHSGTP